MTTQGCRIIRDILFINHFLRERERSQNFAGGNLGPVTGMLLSGALTSAFGWEVVFYTLGSGVIVWFAFYIFLVYGEPAQHPRISQAN